MNKQQIVVQLVAAKLAYNGVNPWAKQLEEFGAVADMIIEMFPEPEYTLAESPLALTIEGNEYHLSAEDIQNIEGANA